MILEHIPTEFIIVYPFTKGLTVKVFVEHVTRMGYNKGFLIYWFSGSFSFMYMYFPFGPHLLFIVLSYCWNDW